jgi:hypothetical protein
MLLAAARGVPRARASRKTVALLVPVRLGRRARRPSGSPSRTDTEPCTPSRCRWRLGAAQPRARPLRIACPVALRTAANIKAFVPLPFSRKGELEGSVRDPASEVLRCGTTIPEQASSPYPAKYGWRVTRRQVADGAYVLDWHCQPFWRRQRGRAASMPPQSDTEGGRTAGAQRARRRASLATA